MKNTICPDSMTIPQDYKLNTHGITQSLIAAFLQCPQKFVYNLNRWTNAKKLDVTNFGSVVHFALAELYKTKDPNFDTIRDALSRYSSANSEEMKLIDQKKIERNFAVAETILSAYLDRHSSDWNGGMKDRECEREIECNIFPHIDVKMRCRIDGSYISKSGEKWLIEHKTKSRISEESLMKRLSFDPQNLFYVISEEKAHGVPVSGVLYNVIRNPQIKPKETESTNDFCARLRDDIKSRPEFYFIRYEIPYTEIDKKRFKMQLRSIIYDIMEIVSGKKWAYRNFYGCDAPYECEFLDACASNSFAGYFQKEKIFDELNCEF